MKAASHVQGDVLCPDAGGVVDHHDLATLEQQRPVAETIDGTHVVGNQNDGPLFLT